MNILLLASRAPYPLHNGEDLRIFYFVKYLSERHKIYMIAYGAENLPGELSSYFEHVQSVSRKAADRPSRNPAARALEALSPNQLYSSDPEIRAVLRDLTSRLKFDLVWIPAWPMIHYLTEVRQIPVYLDLMDDGVLEFARDLRLSRSLKEAAINLKKLWVNFRFERKFFPRAKLCSLVSERDSSILKWVCPKARQVVIPNGVDTEYYTPLGLKENFPSIIFEGNMGFPPAVDAVLYFCRNVLPLIQRDVPNVRFYVVGKDPAPEIRALTDDHVIVTGFVEDVRPYLDRASVFVCPIRKGAGIKNKILQAWSMAKPVVATTTALGGLSAINGENIVVADEPASLAQAVRELLFDGELRRRIGTAARQMVLKHYTWQHKVQLLEDSLRVI
jgi:glycosyltransferase involved in cell wall biosynthesis